MLGTETVVKIAEQYARDVTKILNPKAIVIFGSYAKGTANSDSDIDIAVILDNLTGGYLEISKQLFNLRRNISANIEPILLILSSDKSGFIVEVLRTGIIVYKSQDFNIISYIWWYTLKMHTVKEVFKEVYKDFKFILKPILKSLRELQLIF